MDKRTIRDINVKGKRVLVRVDFNVPLDKSGNIEDDYRIKATLPTIEYLISEGAKVILISHLGRPKGVDNTLRMNPIAKRLSELLGKEVYKLDDCVGSEVESFVKNMREGDVVLLENVRFHPEEEKNDPEFASKLASLAEIFVNDAFGAAHRAHASTYGVAKYLPAVAGFLMEREIRFLSAVRDNPRKPYFIILGGAKISDKIAMIENLLDKVDVFLIGGGMANTFLKALGSNMANSLCENDKLDLARELLNKAKDKGAKIVLPIDLKVAKSLDSSEIKVSPANEVPEGYAAFDIGPHTIELFKKELERARTVFWNGPLGVFEKEPFDEGTNEIARFVVSLEGIISVAGGGDTASALKKTGIDEKFTHVSTGGGASLEFMEGRVLPGIDVLLNK
ncbi:MAG: phosphoglycerate kinase [Synergistetes bacterium]|nr:phosphoglycerate kinase [Synergistota bacterium]MCX8128024.1 phosphoglycerate kinase [Synergistota bacterium]MDW8192781.1 phosphoglycerate kinase [Synergistota bacterium]